MIERFSIIAMLCGLLISPATAEDSSGDTRDVMLLLDDGPLHLRFHITLSGLPLSSRREGFVTQLMQRLDVDGDGHLSQTERRRSPLFSLNRRQIDNPFLRTLKTSTGATRADIERDLSRFGELISYRQDESSAENDFKVFEVLDADGSGTIDRSEMRLAVARIAEHDTDRDQCVSYDEFADPEPVPEGQPAVSVEDDNAPPQSHVAKVIRDTANPTLVAVLIWKYDANRDGVLIAEELNWDDERFVTVDENRDGRLTTRELRSVDRSPVDLDLAIDLTTPDANHGSMRVLHSAADREIPAPRPDLVKLKFGETTVTLSCRQLDPIQAALDNARIRFNALDADGNGYLERPEVENDFRFRRTLFDAMDSDQDEKLYAEEMLAYVQEVCAPAAMSCHVNIYDTGPGYFQMLDASGDGRISIRELRNMETTLAAQQSAPGAGIKPADMGQHYFVEFIRGSYQVFGATDRLLRQQDSFIELDPVGPGWFKALDRNRDGDLTYIVDNPMYPPEFIYHPEDAFAMDADRDGLISHLEAEIYERQLTRGQSERVDASPVSE